MRVAYIGRYQTKEKFPRNQIIISALRLQGIVVDECRLSHHWSRRWLAYLRYGHQLSKADVLIVGAPAHVDMFVAKFWSFVLGRPLVFDPLISLYDTYVNDRKVFAIGSIQARWLRWLDQITMNGADLVLADTQANAQYYAQTLGVLSPITVIPVGTDMHLFTASGKKESSTFTAYYHGRFIPLHGVEVIVEAARLLKAEPIRFVLVGDGSQRKAIEALIKKYDLTNIELQPAVTYDQLPKSMAQADVFLVGPFGGSSKADRVIPNKLYEALAMKLPAIVVETPAMQELFDHSQLLFIQDKSPQTLASALQSAMGDTAGLKALARAGYAHVNQVASPTAIGQRLQLILGEMIRTKD